MRFWNHSKLISQSFMCDSGSCFPASAKIYDFKNPSFFKFLRRKAVFITIYSSIKSKIERETTKQVTFITSLMASPKRQSPELEKFLSPGRRIFLITQKKTSNPFHSILYLNRIAFSCQMSAKVVTFNVAIQSDSLSR